jgi:drug/metabolite transporter (DMT)-like permease
VTGRLSPASLATLLMLAAAGTSALQNLIIRLAGDSGVHSFQIAFLRSFFGFVVIAAIVLAATRRVPRTGAMRQIGASSLFHFVSMLTGFHGITLMPLAESSALTFAGPLFGTLAAAAFLGEKVRLRRWLAILAGFAGVLIVLRPGAVPVGLGPALVLLSTLAGAGMAVMIKRMSATETTSALVFHQSLIMALLTLPPALAVWTTPSPAILAGLAAMGVLGALGWLAFARAFALADASALLPIEFVRLPLVAALGLLFFGEVPDLFVWIGAAVIFAASLSLAHRESAAARLPGK